MNEAENGRSIQSGESDRRDRESAGNRLLGRVVACSGARATISAVCEPGDTSLAELWSVGRLISIKVGDGRVVALVYAMKTSSNGWAEAASNTIHIEVELVGEIRADHNGQPKFSAGISNYPYLGAIAHRIRAGDLRAIYDIGKSDVAVIGKLTQDETMDATIHIPSMLQRHFAVVGTTGVGKSTAVSLLLRKAIEADQDLRIIILDPHNEFAAAFPDAAVVIDTDTLDLPFWLFRLEEFVEVIFRGRPGVAEEIDVLRDLIPEAKRSFRGGADNALFRRASDKSSLTADTPVPYRIADLIALIDERIGRLEGRNEKPYLRALKVRIMSLVNDPRFHFMFSSNTINDTILETIGHLFRIPGNGQPITTFQLAGIPSEVVNSVASVLCRMAFEIALWSNGSIHILVVCEEAHRYVPADQRLGFLPTRQAISRIAKEGRKYGVSLGVITQRPGELDPTILSQCSTVFAMRLANDHDQDIIRSAIPDSSTSTTSFLSSIGNGEAIAFGEAVPVPMRMRFSRLPEASLPKANSGLSAARADAERTDLRAIVQRMRAISTQEMLGLTGNGNFAPQAGEDMQAAPDHQAEGVRLSDDPVRNVLRYYEDREPAPTTSQFHQDAPAPNTHAAPRTPGSLLRRMTDREPAAQSAAAFGGQAGMGSHPASPNGRLQGGPDGMGSRVEPTTPAAPVAAREAALPSGQTTGSELRRDPSIRASLLRKPLGSLLK